MLNNVKDPPFNAKGDGTPDDRVAIQAAIVDAVSNNKGGIFFPAGTYRVGRVPVTGSGGCSLDLNDVQDFMIAGEGPKSVVKLVDTTRETGEWHVFLLRKNCRRVVFKDLVIDGNRTGLTNPDNQSHGIEVESGTEDLVVDRCILRDCFGDGMRMLARLEAEPHVKRLRIENCLFQTNKRSGIVIQRAVEQIIIANCIFDATVSDNSIDIEPSSLDVPTDPPTDVVIQGCIINHTNKARAVTLTGIGGPRPLLRCKFSDNILLGGPIFCTDVNQLIIQNNIILVTDLGAVRREPRIPVHVQRGGDSVLITGNLLVNDDTATKAVIRLSEVNQRHVTRALVANNLCFARVGIGIACVSSDDVAIQGNMIVATGSCVEGIRLDPQVFPMDNISVRDNDITVKGTGAWKFGIRIATSALHLIDHFSVIGNSIRGAAIGVEFKGPGFRQTPVCALNRIADDVASPIKGIGQLPAASVVVGGAASRGGTTKGSGGGRFIVGLGDPSKSDPNKNKVIGNVGDIFQRLDGTPRETLYVKETGNNTDTGWVAK